MIRGVVTGNVWSTKQVEGLPRGAFLDVRVDGTDTTIVAFDVLGSGVGEHVLVAQGSVAANWFPGAPPPLDALVIGSVDDESAEPEAAPHTRAPRTAARAKKTSR